MKKETKSPADAPKEAIKATKRGGYKDPPAITVKNAGPETKKVALEKKLIINIPRSPKPLDCAKKSLK
jgi:hypothetical protein